MSASVDTRASPTGRRPPPHRRRPRGRRRRLLAGVVAVIAAAAGADIALRIAYAGEILPGVRVAGVDVGGMAPAAARRALAAAFSGNRAVTLAYGDRRFSVRAGEVGFAVKGADSAERAYRAGRHDVGGLWAAVAGLGGKPDVEPVVDLDSARLRAVVAAIARQIDRPPFRGGLAVVGRSATIRTVAPRPGRALEQQTTATLITTALTRRARPVLALPVRVRPTVGRSHVEAVARIARAYVRAPLRLSAAGWTVELDRRELAALLDVERTRAAGGPPLRLGVDDQGVQRLVARLAGELHREPVDARLSAPARPLTVDAKGDLTWRPRRGGVQVTPGRSGRRLERTATAAALAAAVRRQRHSAPLAIERVPAALGTSAARDVTSILGTFTTRFACCQPRATNIRLIAEAVDKALIRPGEQFSLNRIAGPRTRAKGYKPAPFIADGKIVPSVGGGVSQFSTTMYNAAYFSGLRIDRHQPHSFYIDRYPPGREATLDYPAIDLAWTNDTDAAVLVRALADGTSVTVTLYGASRVRRVDARSGPRVPRDGGGFTITVRRTIAYRGDRKARQSHTTVYAPPPSDG